MLKRTLALVLVVLMATTAFAACGGTTPATTAATTVAATTAAATTAATTAAAPKLSGGVLNVNLGSEPPEMDGQLSTDTVSFSVLNMVMEGLVRYGKDGSPVPGAAASWDISADGMTYTFTMNKDAKWSNGDAVTAADFEYALKRAILPETASQYAYILYDIKNAVACNSPDAPMDIKELGVKVDGDKLVVTLERPTPYFLSIMAFGTSLPCNQKFFEGTGGEYAADADKLLYNGPFMIKEWVHEDHMILEKNPNYWNKDAINLDGIYYYMIADTATSKIKFFNKELDISGVVGTDFEEFMGKGYKLEDYADGATFYLEFNTEDALMKNKKIRQAFSFGIDRKAYVEKVMKDHSSPALAYVVPILPGKTPSFRAEVGDLLKDNDPAAAKKALAEGLTELGLDPAKPPKFTIILDDGDTNRNRGAALQEMWRTNLGIEVEVQQMPFKARLQKMTDKDFQIVFAGWGPDYNDPMTFLDVFLGGSPNNHTYYASAEYDALINAAKVEADPNKRMDMLYSAEKMLMEDMPIAPVYFRMRTWTKQDGIDGIVRRAIGGDPDFYYATKK